VTIGRLVTVVIGLGAAGGIVPSLRAQGTPEQLLAQAITMLGATEPERAVELLRQLVGDLPATAASSVRRDAQLRLATASWSLGLLDSATVHFQDAARADAFFQPDPDAFNPEEVMAFRAARRAVVAVGVRPPGDTLLDARTGRWPVAVAVSQPGQVQLRLAGLDTAHLAARTVILVVDSTATVSVPVMGADSAPIAPGTYRLVVAYSAPGGTVSDSTVSVDVAPTTPDSLAHEAPPPDSLFRLEFRLEPRSGNALLRSIGVGVGAAAIPLLFGDRRLRTWDTQSRALFVGVAVSVTGLATYIFGRPRRLLPDNIDYNRALRSAWEERDRSIAATNAARRATPMLRIRVVQKP